MRLANVKLHDYEINTAIFRPLQMNSEVMIQKNVDLTKEEVKELIRLYKKEETGSIGGRFFFKWDRWEAKEQMIDMSTMHVLMPNLVPKPVSLIFNKNGGDLNVEGYIMELVEGGRTLDQIDLSLIDLVRRTQIATQLIDAIENLHKNNMVHGDFNFFNVMIDQKGEVKIIDTNLDDENLGCRYPGDVFRICKEEDIKGLIEILDMLLGHDLRTDLIKKVNKKLLDII